ncbi:hypothetical protein JTE90_020031 [Oedothorax gibbosus]|uniref:Solute carrier organic anion transporter family member n=1 Tax=Oedothorax gibbosus TaxID=931172 RepID=A0AAV6UTU4_9ARAC|nr:hypothetical protein JTE90_020031 [Oedothorax gibbosus]
MDAADNKNDELKTNCNGNVTIESPLVKKTDDYERDDSLVDGDNGIIREQGNTGQEKCSIPGLQTPVVENMGDCESDDRPVESDARTIPELEKTGEANCSISEIPSLVVEELGNCEPDDRPVASEAGVITEQENTGKEKISIPELPTLVVEKTDVCEPGVKPVESDVGIIPELEKTSQENILIPELPGLKILEYANKIRAFMGLEDGPDVAKDSPKSDENKESDEHVSLEPELDENVVDKNEPASISLAQPLIVDNTDESNIDNPIDDNECSLGVEDTLSENKKLGNESVATASINTNLNGVTKGNNKCLNDVDDICNSQETQDKPIDQKEVLNQRFSMASTRDIKEDIYKSKDENYVDPDIVCGIGFGNLAYYAVGLAYMDDNAKKKNTPIYLAFAYALRLLGPLVGFLMSYFFLKYYENPFVDPGFGPEDPRWIGGWWMGFMLQGVLVMIFSAPIALFPRRLPGHKLAAATVRKGEGLGSNLAGLWAALKRLGKNPIYIFLVINTIGVIFGGFGHYIMLPKYMENQFRVSASQASLISGPPGISALIVSTLLGGYLVYRFRPNAKFLTGGLAILEIVGAVGFLILTIPKCESIQMSNYGWDGQGLILEGSCNSNCSCTTRSFTPVCSPDGKTHFFSACHAGCHGKVNQTFTECSCIADSFSMDEDSTTEGFCITHGCWNQALIYIITLPIISFIVNILKIANTMVFLRCINTEDKSVALGTFETFLSAFGFIPYPVVFGALVDSACLVWEKSCGQTGNCWFYDITKFNYLLHGASALFTGLSALCMFVVFCLSGRMKDMYKEDEDLDENPKEQNIELTQEGTADYNVTIQFRTMFFQSWSVTLDKIAGILKTKVRLWELETTISAFGFIAFPMLSNR